MKNLVKNINWMTLLPYICLLALVGIYAAGELTLVLSITAIVFLIVAIMASVYHAEEIAHDIGEGLGALVLALSVTIIEVGLIISLMAVGGEGSSAIARDTVFAAIMIVSNGIVGICVLLGGLKFGEIEFQFRGASSLLVVLISLSVFCFILPNYTTSVSGPYYNNSQLIFISIISIVLYVTLVIFQTKTHAYYFASETEAPKGKSNNKKAILTKKVLTSFASLIFGLASVIGLAKFIAPMIESGVASVGAPKAVVGLLIAFIVLLPEAITAILAVRQNKLQTSLNLALGSGAASIALTIPVVSVYSIINSQPLMLGLDPKSMVFLLLTFIVGSLTLGNGKATALSGVIHLIILFAYFAITVLP